MNGLSPFWRKFCLYTSPGFWTLAILHAIFGAFCGAIHCTRDLFKP
jgi:hypothetical protein